MKDLSKAKHGGLRSETDMVDYKEAGNKRHFSFEAGENKNGSSVSTDLAP